MYYIPYVFVFSLPRAGTVFVLYCIGMDGTYSTSLTSFELFDPVCGV